MVQKHPGNIAQVLAIYVFKGAVYLEEGDLGAIAADGTSVYLVSGWVPDFAFFRMLPEFLLFSKEAQAEITYIETLTMKFFRQR